MVGVLKQIVQTASEFVTDMDVYGKNVMMTFKGKEQFKTFHGGLMSLIIKIVIFINCGLLIGVIFQRADTKKAMNKIVKDLTNDETIYYPGKSTFAFALNFPGPDGNNILLDETYIDAQIKQTQYIKANGLYSGNYESIPHEIWNKVLFPSVEDETFIRIGLNKALCPKNNDYQMKSDFNGDDFRLVEVHINKCVNTTSNGNHCKSESDIDTMVTSNKMQVLILTTYFDYDDYESPIKTYVSDLDYMAILLDYTNTLEVKIQQNVAQMSDNVLYTLNPDQKVFYSADNKRVSIFNKEDMGGDLAVIYLNLDRVSVQYERMVYSFMDLFGFIGGLYSYLMIGGSLFVTYFSDKMFYNSIFSNLYQIELSDDKKQDKSTTVRNLYGAKISPNISEQTIQNKNEIDFVDKSDVNEKNWTEQIFEYDTVKESMKRRRRYSFNLCDNLKGTIKKIITWNKPKIPSRIYFNKGINKYNQELDWVNILKSLRNIKALIKLNMTNDQQIINEFSRDNLLECKSNTISWKIRNISNAFIYD